jgi:hypothetical protein
MRVEGLERFAVAYSTHVVLSETRFVVALIIRFGRLVWLILAWFAIVYSPQLENQLINNYSCSHQYALPFRAAGAAL